MKKYILDLTKAKLPATWPATTPLEISVQTGKHLKEFDVSPEEMRKAWAANHIKYLTSMGKIFNQEMPIGFDRASMPKGAKLVEIS
jgi:hypothetical protein